MGYEMKIPTMNGQPIVRELRCCQCGVPTRSHVWDGEYWCHKCWVENDMEKVSREIIAEREKVKQAKIEEREKEKAKENEDNATNDNGNE